MDMHTQSPIIRPAIESSETRRQPRFGGHRILQDSEPRGFRGRDRIREEIYTMHICTVNTTVINSYQLSGTTESVETLKSESPWKFKKSPHAIIVTSVVIILA
jgi:hypothetical protein